MMVGSGSPDAWQWKNTSEFSWTSLSFGPSTIRGFSATALLSREQNALAHFPQPNEIPIKDDTVAEN